MPSSPTRWKPPAAWWREALGLPFISVACALPVNREPRVPLPVMPWGFASDERGEQLNEGSTRVYDWLMPPHARVIRRQAAALRPGAARHGWPNACRRCCR